MDSNATDTIIRYGDPLGFMIRPGGTRSPVLEGSGTDVFKVEARTMIGHQKEAIVTEGNDGAVWRLASDEGEVMKGHDLAPFPLGFFNAGVMGDLHARLAAEAQKQGANLSEAEIEMLHTFGASGSFIHSTALATSEAAQFKIRLKGNATPEQASAVVAAAFDASPAIALLTEPMQENTFALYINGRRKTVIQYANSKAQDAKDPFLVYALPPRPGVPDGRDDLLVKTGSVQQGDLAPIPLTTKEKRLFSIDAKGSGALDGEFAATTWIARPGMSHFRIVSGHRQEHNAPSGLGLMSAGIALCFLTQLLRYIDAQKLNIGGARLVQYNPYTTGDVVRAGAIDTHLFLNGAAPDELHQKLLTIAAHTCFMHAAASGSTEPEIEIELNGEEIGI